MQASSVEIRKVNKFYGPFHALKDVDLTIPPGKVTCLIGPSGSGKSTLLRCINFLEEYDSGEVRIDGQLIGYEVPGRKMTGRKLREMRRSIGMVFQQFNLWPHMTALGNVAEGLVRVRGLPRAEARERAEAMLQKVGVADKRGHYPGQLSGGQQQRVAIARALAVDPALVHADADEAAPVLAAADDRPWLITAYTSRTLELYASGDRDGSVAAAGDAVAIARTTTPERLADALGAGPQAGAEVGLRSVRTPFA